MLVSTHTCKPICVCTILYTCCTMARYTFSRYRTVFAPQTLCHDTSNSTTGSDGEHWSSLDGLPQHEYGEYMWATYSWTWTINSTNTMTNKPFIREPKPAGELPMWVVHVGSPSQIQAAARHRLPQCFEARFIAQIWQSSQRLYNCTILHFCDVLIITLFFWVLVCVREAWLEPHSPENQHVLHTFVTLPGIVLFPDLF